MGAMGKKKPEKKRAKTEFVFVVSDKAKAYRVAKNREDSPVMGKKIGDTIDGNFLGLEGYQLRVTGGTDRDGVCMHPDVEGIGRKDLVLKKGIGFSGKIRGKKIKKKPRKIEGIRKRKLIRGNAISEMTAQINLVVQQAGAKTVAESLGVSEKKEEAAPAEKPKEEQKEAPKEEAKPEEKKG